ncbi:GNAT family N-acetyltransferase [Paenibacillus thalictri]|uniref:GNAT family N-acetyltransferase n=1 Tax=Paenibacillus thalictri TaxID=2527873 RepID=A0A4Q9DPE1_9BACL|nr:GNAT family N-acetyltransferase [Paenibacillus thalictri]TBL76001.1 GNAT family N-acetyltransferase [Paenibacillus thalictri]
MMEIRPYIPGDDGDLTELMADLGYPTTMDKMIQRMEVISATPHCYTFVAVKDGAVVGMIGCRDIYYYEEDGVVTQISILVTKQELQGQGIGKALVTFAEQWAREKGSNALYLTSGIKPERERAHAFYKRMGFAVTGYRFVKPLKQ